MTKVSIKKIEDLKLECELLELNPIPTKNRKNKKTGEYYLDYTKEDLINALQSYYIDKYKEQGLYSKSLEYILKIDSPMLALPIKSKESLDNKKWIVEEKINGIRQLLCWFKEDKKLNSYSRELSDSNYLPINYGQNLYNNINIPLSIPNFVIDGELVLNKQDNDSLYLLKDILYSDQKTSKELQINNKVTFIVFDILMYDNQDLTSLPLVDRKKYLDLIYNDLKNLINIEMINNGNGLSINDFYNQIISLGGEGIILKDSNSLYDIKGKRSGEWLKIKRSNTNSLLEKRYGDTFDCFVIGFNKDISNNYIESLNFGIYLLDKNNNIILNDRGVPYIHFIATVNNLPEELKRAITVRDFNNNIQLRYDIYGAIGVIDGQSITKDFKLNNAKLIQWRTDKSVQQCNIRKDFLERLIV